MGPNDSSGNPRPRKRAIPAASRDSEDPRQSARIERVAPPRGAEDKRAPQQVAAAQRERKAAAAARFRMDLVICAIVVAVCLLSLLLFAISHNFRGFGGFLGLAAFIMGACFGVSRANKEGYLPEDSMQQADLGSRILFRNYYGIKRLIEYYTAQFSCARRNRNSSSLIWVCRYSAFFFMLFITMLVSVTRDSGRGPSDTGSSGKPEVVTGEARVRTSC